MKDAEVTQLKGINVNPHISAGVLEKYLKSIFDSIGVQKLFATCFDEEIYRQAGTFFANNDYHPLRHCYSVIAITKVIEDIIASQSVLSPVQGMERFIHGNYYKADNDREILEHLNDYITARIDIKLYGDNTDLEIISVSDERAYILKPQWFQDGGAGYVVESHAGNIELTLRSAKGGNLEICQKARCVRDEKGNGIPYWVSYQKVQYNGNIIESAQDMASHDMPICLRYPVEAGEDICYYAKWLPYRGDYGDLQKIEQQEKEIDKIQKQLKGKKTSLRIRKKR